MCYVSSCNKTQIKEKKNDNIEKKLFPLEPEMGKCHVSFRLQSTVTASGEQKSISCGCKRPSREAWRRAEGGGRSSRCPAAHALST